MIVQNLLYKLFFYFVLIGNRFFSGTERKELNNTHVYNEIGGGRFSN